MFIGHFGLGFAGKKAAPSVSLGTLFLSVQLADGLWPLFLVLGLEHVRIVPGITKLSPFDFYNYPISHSLVALLGWGIAAGIAAGVVSHWVLDFAVHRPDMPVAPAGKTGAIRALSTRLAPRQSHQSRLSHRLLLRIYCQ